MSREEDNKVLVGRWFTEFWGETCKLRVVDELAAPDMLLQYSCMHRAVVVKTSRRSCPDFVKRSRTSISGALGT
jgi:hypothetical protein